MEFYDLHVRTDEIEETVEKASRLELTGIAVAEYSDDFDGFKETRRRLKELQEDTDLDLVVSVAISPDSIKELKDDLSRYRPLSEIVTVLGGDYSINRAACQDSRVDLLAHPEYRRKDSGLDHVAAKAAAENGVAIELNTSNLLNTYGRIRSHILNHMARNITLCEKFDVPLVITSGAMDPWSLRDPRSMAAIGQILGMRLEDAMDSVSEVPGKIIEDNRKKLEGKILYEGVELEA